MKLLIPAYFDTERLQLSRLQYEDAEEIFYTYASKPEATKFVSWPTHTRIRDTHQYLRSTVNGWDAGVDYSFSIRSKKDRRLVGSFGLLHDLGKIQFGYILGPTYWGSGLATEACVKLMEIVRSLPGIYRVGTFVDAENVASERVLIKSGLVVEARLEKWFRFVNQNNREKDCVLFRLPLNKS